jgi:recF protein
MTLQELHIINFKNIQEADLKFADKLNCFVGQNGQGKTNLLDAIYYLSFTKSAFNPIDSQNIRHDAEFAMIQGIYRPFSGPSLIGQGVSAATSEDDDIQVTCAIRRGQKKQFRCGKKDYQRMLDHIGRIPLVMVSPEDNQLIAEGSDERRRFLDIIIGQTDRAYLEHLSMYNALVKQRNALLKQYAEASVIPEDLFEVLEHQMVPHAMYIFEHRRTFVDAFVPLFAELYKTIAEVEEQPQLTYRSQLLDRDLSESLRRTRQRDLILGWTSQGVHKDELEMQLGEYPLRRVGSQGQQKTYLIAMKLAQALYFNACKPILLLDDIFDKLDASRVARIIDMVRGEQFGQIFLTDTDRQHLTDIVQPLGSSKVFYVSGGDFRAG